ncbi:MAG: polyphosphate kinase 2, partial [Gammaproteobacteria bacterium]
MTKNKNKSDKPHYTEIDVTQSIDDEPPTDLKDIETHETERESAHARNKEMEAISDIVAHDLKKGDFKAVSEHLDAILKGASPDDIEKLQGVFINHSLSKALTGKVSSDDELVDDWRNQQYPYKNRMKRKTYEQQKYHL